MSRAARSIGICLLAMSATGCWWTMPGEGPDRQAHNRAESTLTVDNVADLTERWSAPVGTGPVSDPVTSARGVHVTDGSAVYAFNPASGASLWNQPIPGGGVQQPYVLGEQVLVGSIDVDKPKTWSGRCWRSTPPPGPSSRWRQTACRSRYETTALCSGPGST